VARPVNNGCGWDACTPPQSRGPHISESIKPEGFRDSLHLCNGILIYRKESFVKTAVCYAHPLDATPFFRLPFPFYVIHPCIHPFRHQLFVVSEEKEKVDSYKINRR
jgi:hypothetical protein